MMNLMLSVLLIFALASCDWEEPQDVSQSIPSSKSSHAPEVVTPAPELPSSYIQGSIQWELSDRDDDYVKNPKNFNSGEHWTVMGTEYRTDSTPRKFYSYGDQTYRLEKPILIMKQNPERLEIIFPKVFSGKLDHIDGTLLVNQNARYNLRVGGGSSKKDQYLRFWINDLDSALKNPDVNEKDQLEIRLNFKSEEERYQLTIPLSWNLKPPVIEVIDLESFRELGPLTPGYVSQIKVDERGTYHLIGGFRVENPNSKKMVLKYLGKNGGKLKYFTASRVHQDLGRKAPFHKYEVSEKEVCLSEDILIFPFSDSTELSFREFESQDETNVPFHDLEIAPKGVQILGIYALDEIDYDKRRSPEGRLGEILKKDYQAINTMTERSLPTGWSPVYKWFDRSYGRGQERRKVGEKRNHQNFLVGRTLTPLMLEMIDWDTSGFVLPAGYHQDDLSFFQLLGLFPEEMPVLGHESAKELTVWPLTKNIGNENE